MELWQGNILIDDWSASASGILKIDETATVERNKTYKLTVNYTVNGVAQTDCRLQGYAIDGNMATRTDSNNSTVTAFFYELPSSGCWRVVSYDVGKSAEESEALSAMASSFELS